MLLVKESPVASAAQQTEVKAPEFPSPASDLLLEREVIPSSASERAKLKKQLLREMRIAAQEKDILTREIDDPRAVPTTVGRFTNFLVERAKALNPWRDFNKIGLSAFLGGENPWKDDQWAQTMLTAGLIGSYMATMLTAVLSHNVPAAIGAGVLVASPLFLPMLAGRTVFNILAGAAAAVVAPVAYCAARIVDLEAGAGFLHAKKFLADMKKVRIADDEKRDIRSRRAALLNEAIVKREQRVSEIESCEDKIDRDLMEKRYLDPGKLG